MRRERAERGGLVRRERAERGGLVRRERAERAIKICERAERANFRAE